MPASTPWKRIVPAFAASLLLAAGSAQAAIDAFLKIDGIKGESTDARHKDEIDVLSWSWGVSPKEEGKTGKRGCVQDLAITKYVDRATPALFAAAAMGTQVASAVLTVRKAGEGPQEFLTLTLNQVYVTSVQQSGAGGAGQLFEQATLRASTIVVSYRPQNPDGSLGAPVTTSVSGSC
ncbi:MAG: Hcp family type VI secretion system effector [Burkholderiales bacterium]